MLADEGWTPKLRINKAEIRTLWHNLLRDIIVRVGQEEEFWEIQVEESGLPSKKAPKLGGGETTTDCLIDLNDASFTTIV